jgi:hypothetical protein
MSNIRIFELAKELKKQPKEVLDVLTSLGIDGKTPSSTINETEARQVRGIIVQGNTLPSQQVARISPQAEQFQAEQEESLAPIGLAQVDGQLDRLTKLLDEANQLVANLCNRETEILRREQLLIEKERRMADAAPDPLEELVLQTIEELTGHATSERTLSDSKKRLDDAWKKFKLGELHYRDAINDCGQCIEGIVKVVARPYTSEINTAVTEFYTERRRRPPTGTLRLLVGLQEIGLLDEKVDWAIFNGVPNLRNEGSHINPFNPCQDTARMVILSTCGAVKCLLNAPFNPRRAMIQTQKAHCASSPTASENSTES